MSHFVAMYIAIFSNVQIVERVIQFRGLLGWQLNGGKKITNLLRIGAEASKLWCMNRNCIGSCILLHKQWVNFLRYQVDGKSVRNVQLIKRIQLFVI